MDIGLLLAARGRGFAALTQALLAGDVAAWGLVLILLLIVVAFGVLFGSGGRDAMQAGAPLRPAQFFGNTTAVMQRELASLFFSPIGYVVIAGFLLLTGVFVLVTEVFEPGKPASLRRVFDFTPYILTIIIPAISMRLISEEYRSGTIETLMTAPLSDFQMVLGKYLAGVIFYATMLGGTLVYLLLLSLYGNPDWGASLSSYFGLLLVGLAFMAFGTFTSSLSSNQVVAWILGMIPLMLFVWFASFIVGKTSGFLRDVMQRVNIVRHLDQFNRGLVTTESLVFFLAVAAFFIFATVKVVESKRWR